jgi:hypothetical protein
MHIISKDFSGLFPFMDTLLNLLFRFGKEIIQGNLLTYRYKVDTISYVCLKRKRMTE